mgnify:CR=1 FL=1
MGIALAALEGEVLEDGDVGTNDLERRQVTQGGREIHLTPTEWHVLEVLARFARAVRDSPSVDPRSGVSARFAIAAAETVAGSARSNGVAAIGATFVKRHSSSRTVGNPRERNRANASPRARAASPLPNAGSRRNASNAVVSVSCRSAT